MTERRQSWLIGGAVIVLVCLAFVSGQEVETRRIANAAPVSNSSDKPQIISPTPPPLRFEATEIANVPFADLYEQLRFSSHETRLAIGEKIKAMPEGPAKEAARFAYNKLMVQIAPADSANGMLEIPNDGETLRTVLGAAPQSAMETFASMILKLPNTGDVSLSRKIAFDEVLQKWSRIDPEPAARFLEKNYDETDFSAYAAIVVENWAAVDPQAAMEWIGKLDPSRTGWELNGALLDGWFQHDRAAAMDYAVAHASGEDFGLTTRDFAETIFCASPEEARAFINRLPSGREEAVDYIASVFRDVSDEGYLAPRDMAKWLMQFPTELWEKSIWHAISDWKSEDAREFFAWAAQLPAETQDRIVAQYSGADTNYVPDVNDIERDLHLAATAPDPLLRYKLLSQMVSQFGSKFRENKEALQQLPISQSEKDALLKLIPKRHSD
jgi:hypothetical protein